MKVIKNSSCLIVGAGKKQELRWPQWGSNSLDRQKCTAAFDPWIEPCPARCNRVLRKRIGSEQWTQVMAYLFQVQRVAYHKWLQCCQEQFCNKAFLTVTFQRETYFWSVLDDDKGTNTKIAKVRNSLPSASDCSFSASTSSQVSLLQICHHKLRKRFKRMRTSREQASHTTLLRLVQKSNMKQYL